MLSTRAGKKPNGSSCLARDYPSAPLRAGHRTSPEFANIQSIAQNAYFAGLFDGEGCVSSQIPNRANRPSAARTVVCQVIMIDKEAIEALAAAFGGSVLNRDMTKWNRNARPTFQWSVSGQIALGFMKAIFPYSLVKREQLELAIQIQECISANKSITARRPNPHPDKDAILARRLDLALRLADLKRSPTSR